MLNTYKFFIKTTNHSKMTAISKNRKVFIFHFRKGYIQQSSVAGPVWCSYPIVPIKSVSWLPQLFDLRVRLFTLLQLFPSIISTISTVKNSGWRNMSPVSLSRIHRHLYNFLSPLTSRTSTLQILSTLLF